LPLKKKDGADFEEEWARTRGGGGSTGGAEEEPKKTSCQVGMEKKKKKKGNSWEKRVKGKSPRGGNKTSSQAK